MHCQLYVLFFPQTVLRGPLTLQLPTTLHETVDFESELVQIHHFINTLVVVEPRA